MAETGVKSGLSSSSTFKPSDSNPPEAKTQQRPKHEGMVKRKVKSK